MKGWTSQHLHAAQQRTKAKGNTAPRDRGMNKTEARYAAHLDALEKMKIAAETYWMFTVKAVWEVNGSWQERVF